MSAQFWTLTYRDAPEIGDYDDIKKFLNRYRSWNRRRGVPTSIRYLACGEYGAKSGRFHFHALTFNGLSPDRDRCRTRLWPHGFVYIGTVTPASIRYTARYTLKFEAKGREAQAGWSRRPPLGSDGMRQIARYMKDRGDQLECPPTTLSIEGRTYPLDRAMQVEFAEEFEPSWVRKHPGTGLRSLTTSSLARPLMAYYEHHVLGDPIEQQRRAREERARFYETARFHNEQL